MMRSLVVVCFLAALSISADAKCEDGWIESTEFSKCYKFETKTQTWYGAQQSCVGMGGNLLMFESKEEVNAVKDIRRGKPELGSVIWIGARRVNTGWYWLLYQKRPRQMTFTDWACNQPENNPRQGCMFTAEESANFQWHDAPCMEKRAYICEKNSA